MFQKPGARRVLYMIWHSMSPAEYVASDSELERMCSSVVSACTGTPWCSTVQRDSAATAFAARNVTTLSNVCSGRNCAYAPPSGAGASAGSTSSVM